MENNSIYLENGLRLVVDWVGFTVTADMSVVQVIEFMGFSPMLFNDMPRGSNGYKCMKKHGSHEISVLYDGTDGMGIHVNASGSAISALLSSFKNTLSIDTPFGVGYDLWDDTVLSRFMKEVLSIGHFTRVDIAIDDIGCNYYSLDELAGKLKSGSVVSRFRKYREVCELSIASDGEYGHTIYFGSRESAIMFRVYDKKLEQNMGLSPDDMGYFHEEWVRWELELHKERSNELARLLIDGHAFSDVSVGVLSYYFRIIVHDDSNKSRCSNDSKWDDFINGISKLRLASPNTEKTLDDKERWIDKQVAPSLAAMIIFHDGDADYLNEIALKNVYRISARDKEMLRVERPDIFERYFGEDKEC